jgi:hypothetical protein
LPAGLRFAALRSSMMNSRCGQTRLAQGLDTANDEPARLS